MNSHSHRSQSVVFVKLGIIITQKLLKSFHEIRLEEIKIDFTIYRLIQILKIQNKLKSH